MLIGSITNLFIPLAAKNGTIPLFVCLFLTGMAHVTFFFKMAYIYKIIFNLYKFFESRERHGRVLVRFGPIGHTHWKELEWLDFQVQALELETSWLWRLVGFCV